MNILPNEIVSQIAGELKGNDIVNFFLTSKRFYSICDDVFWKNKILKEFPQSQICEDLKKEYLKNFFGFFTLILMESSHSIDISIKRLFECNVDILMTNYSTDREEALSTIKKDLLPTICSINYPEIYGIIPLSPSYLLKYNDARRLLDGSASQYTDYLSNNINSKEFLSIKNRIKGYYKYTIFGKRVKCGNNTTPRKIYAFVATNTYWWNCRKTTDTYIETVLNFLDFFKTREDIIKFVSGYGMCNIISIFHNKNIIINKNEYDYITLSLPNYLKKRDKVGFDACKAYSIFGDIYDRRSDFEIIEIPLENRKVLKTTTPAIFL